MKSCPRGASPSLGQKRRRQSPMLGYSHGLVKRLKLTPFPRDTRAPAQDGRRGCGGPALLYLAVWLRVSCFPSLDFSLLICKMRVERSLNRVIETVIGTQSPQNSVAPLLPLWAAHGIVCWNALCHFPSSPGWRRSGLQALGEGNMTKNNQPGQSWLWGCCPA
mgnify:CR=1 FL=1